MKNIWSLWNTNSLKVNFKGKTKLSQEVGCRVSVFRNILNPLSFEWQINSKHILPYWNSTIVPNLFYSLSPFGIMIFCTLEKYFYGVVIYYQHFVKSRKRPKNLLQCFSPPAAACVIRNTSIKVLCTEEGNENLKHTKTLAGAGFMCKL